MNGRVYDPYLQRFLSPDRFVQNPDDPQNYNRYSYCVNNPLRYVDWSGWLILFVNGFNTGDGGNRKYWGGKDNEIMGIIGDYNAEYFDGATCSFLGNNNTDVDEREDAGYETGYDNAQRIISSLADNESIKFVSHSMGAAFSKGMIKGMQKYALENNLTLNIEFEVDIAPYQPSKQSANPIVPTIQISHYGDGIANTFQNNGKIEGAKVHYTNRWGQIAKDASPFYSPFIATTFLGRGYYQHRVSEFNHDDLKEYIPNNSSQNNSAYTKDKPNRVEHGTSKGNFNSTEYGVYNYLKDNIINIISKLPPIGPPKTKIPPYLFN